MESVRETAKATARMGPSGISDDMDPAVVAKPYEFGFGSGHSCPESKSGPYFLHKDVVGSVFI
jgi:hypothetical protein